jgi:hypothetical protein
MIPFNFNLIIENESLKKLREIKAFSANNPEARNKAIEAALQNYFSKLVPTSGNAKTIEGEMIRAINRIIYRAYNDGDYFWEGYGTESVAPALSFLVNSRSIPIEVRRQLIDIERETVGEKDERYENLIFQMAEVIINYIDSKNGEYTESNEDMWDYESEYEEEEEEDEDDYYEDEEEDLDEILKESLTKKQEEYKEDYFKSLKGNKKNFEKLYGHNKAEQVMYGTAIKMAKEKSKKKGKEKLKELVSTALSTPPKKLEEIQPIAPTSPEVPFLTAEEVINLIGKKGEASVGDKFKYGNIEMEVAIKGDGTLVAQSISTTDRTVIPIKFEESSSKDKLKETIKSILKNPKAADRNKDGELSSWEKKVGAAIEKSMASKSTKNEIKAISPYEPEEDPCDEIEGWGSSDQAAMNRSIHSDLGNPTEFPSLNSVLDAVRENVDFYFDYEIDCGEDEEDLVRNHFQRYMRAYWPDLYRKFQEFFATNNDDIMENYTNEDLDLGHEDNEPHMLKGELYRIGKYAMELYQMVDQFEYGQGEVDFPAWWQAMITDAASKMVKAKHYLDFELKEPEIDAMVSVATDEDIIKSTPTEPLDLEIEEALPPGYWNKKYGIGGKKKMTKEEIVNETFKSFVQKLSPKLGKSYATNLAGTIAAAKRKGAGKGPTAKQKARMK